MARNRLNSLFFTGLLFLVAANMWHWLLRSSSLLAENWIDGIHGLFIGVAIGALLLSLARGRGAGCAR